MEQRLRRLFHGVLDGVRGASLAGPLAVVAGCGIDVSPDFTVPGCTSDGVLTVDDVHPAAPADYLELRYDSPFSPSPNVARSGQPCATAQDKSACAAAIASARSDTGFGGTCGPAQCFYYLVVNRGDQVQVLASAAALTAFLAPIDSNQEAALLALAGHYDVHCSGRESGSARPVSGGYEVIALRETSSCDPVETSRFLLRVTSGGQISVQQSEVVSSHSGVCSGRRPAGLAQDRHPRRPGPGSAAGRYLAAAAQLEAASVDAFQVLHAELRALGAPRRLLRAARRAARDEVRHSRQVGHLARRFGQEPPAAVVAPRSLRSLEEVLIENAVEGCVRETCGALIGLWQAQQAADPQVAAVMRQVAADEVRHAALAWEVRRWAWPRLAPEARQRVLQAQRRAAADLRQELAAEPEAELRHLCGLPAAADAERLWAALDAGLWAA